MTPHIAIVTGAHLCRNPRVVKEAEALSQAGYRVTVLRPVLDAALAAQDAEIAAGAAWTVRTTTDLTTGRVRPFRARLVRRAAGEAVRRGLQAPDALGYGVRRTLRLARALGADLTIGHQEVGLWVANRLADAGHRVGVDLEDWYSEDLPPEARQSRPVGLLRREEAVAVRRGGHVTTTSEALAEGLARATGGPLPTVVYNAFPLANRAGLDGMVKDRREGDPSRLSLHWVSQTLGPGRGIEEVLAALAQVQTPVELHLRGACTPQAEADLRRQLPAGHALFVHGLVPPGELLSRIAEHDVGLALELGTSVNNDLTASNKIHHYLLAGLPVIASATAGQQEVARKAPRAVQTFAVGDTTALARAIAAYASDRAALDAASDSALEAASQEFSWEVQQQILTESVRASLVGRGGASATNIGQASRTRTTGRAIV